MSYEPEDWLITFDDFKDKDGKPFRDGRPFGDGTEMALRVKDGKYPWDKGCIVEPLVGGYLTMKAIRESFETIINEAINSGIPFGQERGHVYIAGWRLNANRDMSENFDPDEDYSLRTAFGLIRRMMEKGIKVRILLWMPPDPYLVDPFEEHIKAHIYLAKLVQSLNDQLKYNYNLTDDIGVVFLDSRLAERCASTASHHQKFIVIRGLQTHVAFCGGVDLAYTRRDFPDYNGDWQSGSGIPKHYEQVGYPNKLSEGQMGSDLPKIYESYGNKRHIWHDQHLKLHGPIVSTLENIFRIRWSIPTLKNDFHYILKVHEDGEEVPINKFGSIISSSETAFKEEDVFKEFDMTNKVDIAFDNYYKSGSLEVWSQGKRLMHSFSPKSGYVWITSTYAPSILRPLDLFKIKRITVKYKKDIIQPLSEVKTIAEISSSNTSIVQPWQTIPLRERALGNYANLTSDLSGTLTKVPYMRGEFSIMAGISKACLNASQMVFIVDQYFWSVPYANLLAKRLKSDSDNKLHVIIILPPYSDQLTKLNATYQHDLRRRALLPLNDPQIRQRVRVYALWKDKVNGGKGIYCHAKVQLFDDALLICGSSNINRRSYTVDTELTCAIMNKQLVQNHYRTLWNYLFNNNETNDQDFIPFPAISFTEENWGSRLFNEFYDASQHGIGIRTKIFLDPWMNNSVMPDGTLRINLVNTNPFVDINNPSGLDKAVGEPIPTITLFDIVKRIEGEKSDSMRRQ